MGFSQGQSHWIWLREFQLCRHFRQIWQVGYFIVQILISNLFLSSRASPFYCFVHSRNCECGSCATSVSLDLAQGVLALSSLSRFGRLVILLCGFQFLTFSYQVGPFHFIVFTPFQFLFLVETCQEADNQCSPPFLFASFA